MDCLLCIVEEETVEHFDMKCQVIRMIRERRGVRGGVSI